MPRPDSPPLTRGVVLRAIGLTVAIGLGAVGVWLIAKGDSTKQVQIGAFAGFWGLLVGAFAIFGTRRLQLETPGEALHAGAPPGSAVELRSRGSELERADEAMLRREHEARLEHMLRREIHAAVSREVSTLRAEIADLRSELVEKVGGQLRLERIETTRVIGSDLEALQHELRALKNAAQDSESLRPRVTETTSVRQIVEPARVRPVTRQTAEAEADVQPARQPAREPEVILRKEPEAVPRTEAPRPVVPSTEQTTPIRMPPAEPRPSAEPRPAEPTSVEPTLAEPRPAEPKPAAASTLPTAGIPSAPPPSAPPPAAPSPPPAAPSPPPPAAPAPTPAPPPEPRPSPVLGSDPFAGLPRIRPFTDFELDPIEEEPSYHGRRRRGDETESGRRGEDVPEDSAGRRRAAEDGDDLLARLLARER